MPVNLETKPKVSELKTSHKVPIELRKKRISLTPLLPVAIIICAGIMFANFLYAPTDFWILLSGIAILSSCVCNYFKQLKSLTTILICISIFFLASSRYALTAQTIENNSISLVTSYHPALATLKGTITSYPQMVQPRVTIGYKGKPTLKFLLEVSHFKTRTGWQKSTGIVRVSVSDCFKKLLPGDQVEIAGKIGKFRPPSNPGQFDSQNYSKQTGIWAYLKANCSEAITKINNPENSSFFTAISKLRWRLKSYTREHLVEDGQLENGHIVDALILGNRKQSLQTLNRTMQQAGIAHFLSISGLHLGIFLGFMFLVCRIFGLSKNTTSWLVLIFLALYLLAAESRAPILRSAIMATCILLGSITSRKISALNSLSLAFIILTIFDPLAIFNAGFQMSFLIVAGIITLYRPMRKIFFGKFIRNRGLIVFRSDQNIKRWVYFELANWCISFITVSVVAYLIAAPLAAYHFGTISPYAVLLSMIFMPLISAILVTGYISLGLSIIAPGISTMLASWSAKLSGILASSTDLLNTLPFLAIKLRPIFAISIVTYFLLIACFIKLQNKKPARIFSCIILLAILVATIIPSQHTSTTGNCARFDMLAVGSGQCAILQSPSGNTYFFDAGSRGGFDIHKSVISKFVRHNRLPNPKAIFISHANSDHYSAVPSIINSGFCNNFYASKLLGKKPKQYSLESKIMNILHKANSKLNPLCAGDNFQLDKFTKVEVIWPAKNFESKKRNQTSLVYRVTCCDKSILFTGDIDNKIQARLLRDSRKKLKADILIWPRHGCKDKSIPEFIKAVNPKLLLVSSRKDPLMSISGKSNQSAFYKSIRKKYRYYCTASVGWIGLTISPAEISVRTMH